MEAEVELPTDKDLRPDIVCFMLEEDEDENALLGLLRYATGDDKLPTYWEGPLTWFSLRDATTGASTKANSDDID